MMLHLSEHQFSLVKVPKLGYVQGQNGLVSKQEYRNIDLRYKQNEQNSPKIARMLRLGASFSNHGT